MVCVRNKSVDTMHKRDTEEVMMVMMIIIIIIITIIIFNTSYSENILKNLKLSDTTSKFRVVIIYIIILCK